MTEKSDAAKASKEQMARQAESAAYEALLDEITALSREDQELLRALRKARADRAPGDTGPITLGERTADRIASIVGSWRFIIIQSGLLLCWLVANSMGWINAWDPYPFILLNLMLSFQAAYTAPVILMSQNRQAAVDRLTQRFDYEVNLKAELEIELLHQKIDLLRAREIERLTTVIEDLRTRLGEKGLAGG